MALPFIGDIIDFYYHRDSIARLFGQLLIGHFIEPFSGLTFLASEFITFDSKHSS